MIRHVVLMRWAEAATPVEVDQVHGRLSALPDVVPGILRYEFGDDLGLTDGAWDFAVVADFESVEGYRTYAGHPAHLAVIEEAVQPIVAEVARVQYEV